jgi:hypothetical protein
MPVHIPKIGCVEDIWDLRVQHAGFPHHWLTHPLLLPYYNPDGRLVYAEAAQCADRMQRRGDHDELLAWFRIWRTATYANRLAKRDRR